MSEQDERYEIIEKFFHGVPASELHHVLHVMHDAAGESVRLAEHLRQWKMPREKLVERSMDLDLLLEALDPVFQQVVDTWDAHEEKWPIPDNISGPLSELFSMLCVIEDAYDTPESMPDSDNPVQSTRSSSRRRHGRGRNGV